jgi:hypothetical protein
MVASSPGTAASRVQPDHASLAGDDAAPASDAWNVLDGPTRRMVRSTR